MSSVLTRTTAATLSAIALIDAARHHDSVSRLGPLPMLGVLAVLHHHAHGSAVDYTGVFLGTAVSWVGLPGPGEAVLIAAGISAAHGHLDLALVVAVGWVGASVGGTAGWIVGVKGGRGLLTRAGPLRQLRVGVIAGGDRFYERYGPAAVLFTPSWIAGIHHMRWQRFLPANTISALIWALAVSVGAYLLGPSVADIVGDTGFVGALLIGALFLLTVVLVVWRRSHQSA
jgi:membrane protein DedA with SNARE-associated domain